MVYSLAANLELLFMNILITVVLFLFNLRYWKPRVINPLSSIYILVVTGSLFEMIAFYVDGKPDMISLNYLSNIMFLGGIGTIAACFLLFCNEQFPEPIWKNRKQQFLIYIPFMIEVASLVSSPVTGLIMTIDEAGYYHRTSSFVIQMIPYIYLAIATVYGLYWYFKSEARRERSQFLAIAMFVIPPSVFGMLQAMLIPNAIDTVMYSITVSLLANYAVSQNNRITRDTLTRLPNREVMESAILEVMQAIRRGKDTNLYILACDMDKFKHINDTYGHLEGDRALIKAADILYNVSKKYRATAARFGGDEFIIILEGDSDELPKMLINDIEAELLEASKEVTYQLSMSIGYAKYNLTGTISDILKAADQDLYRVKAQHKTLDR